MAGGFAHITLVDTICRDKKVLDGIENLTEYMKHVLAINSNFVELGAVSPDYPYLSLMDENSAGWANVMHYWKTLDFVRKAIPLVHDMDWRRDFTARCMAWLFGYAAHVVTDLTVHPVVNLKVGPFERNKRKHRVCEMNQDAYIFHKVNKIELVDSDYLQEGGITSCCDRNDAKRLDAAVTELWKQCLPLVGADFQFRPSVARPTEPPDPDKWHRNFVRMIDKFAEEGVRLPPLSRHLAQYEGLVYPRLKDLDRDYIDRLPTPEEEMPYDEVFWRAQTNVKAVWSQLGKALDTGKPEHLTFPNGNLDTGCDESGKMIFWRAAD